MFASSAGLVGCDLRLRDAWRMWAGHPGIPRVTRRRDDLWFILRKTRYGTNGQTCVIEGVKKTWLNPCFFF